jgi:hypothetical protein
MEKKKYFSHNRWVLKMGYFTNGASFLIIATCCFLGMSLSNAKHTNKQSSQTLDCFGITALNMFLLNFNRLAMTRLRHWGKFSRFRRLRHCETCINLVINKNLTCRSKQSKKSTFQSMTPLLVCHLAFG